MSTKQDLVDSLSNPVFAKVSHDFDLENHLPYCLARATNRISEIAFATYKSIDQDTNSLNLREFRTLMLVCNSGPISPAKVADATGMERATVTRALVGLKKKKLIVDFQNDRDRRAKYLVLTAAGAKICDKIIPVMQGFGDNLESIFSPKEAELLKEMLNRIFAHATQLTP